MSDLDPYVATPVERRRAGRLDGLRAWLALCVLVLLMASWLAIGFVNGRQDPSLEIPADVFGPTDGVEAPGLTAPEAPTGGQ